MPLKMILTFVKSYLLRDRRREETPRAPRKVPGPDKSRVGKLWGNLQYSANKLDACLAHVSGIGKSVPGFRETHHQNPTYINSYLIAPLVFRLKRGASSASQSSTHCHQYLSEAELKEEKSLLPRPHIFTFQASE